MATDYFIRTETANGVENIEIDQMTNEQLDELERLQPDKGWMWAKALARWIRDNVTEE